MTRTLSLRLRLTIIILAPLLGISVGVAIWAAGDAQARAADRFDRSLLVTALGISRDTANSGGDALSQDTRDLLRNTSGGRVFYHVYAPDGVFVTGYATPPVPPGMLEAQDYIYFDALYQGRPVRAVRFTDRMDIDGLSGDFTFTVWQDLALRDGFVQSLSRRTYAVMATLVVAVALIVWFGVRLGMGPLLDLENAIARRSSQDLTPIGRPIPEEVQGIVGRLNALFSEMSATIRAKDIFISDAAHQLRNPISGVVALSEAVAASKTEEDFKARSADLTEAASHAAKLTEDLLAFERARSAPPVEDLPFEDLADVLDDVVARQRRRADERGVHLQLLANEPPVQVRADRTLLEQAIENLVANALLHGGDAMSEIEVWLETSDQNATITVGDNGQGIDPSKYDTALSRFGQVSPGSGSGLGLPIANAVAEAHGGHLALSGNGGSGLMVRMSIPRTSERQINML
ncbi:sensor histidine kinase [Roseobacter sp. HKCCD9010]|uniref:sensor histidine kinase n=1 Tax=unclassified Roseobacter TaxID=196798 RepID=UPI001492DF24|nr:MULTISPECIES: sensor histidine kinase [unclassified Roseobacter]MBF9052137.1 sensor histidine kinase [Rhodobacterales bacterium HKCCD4356]NNV14057.1 sensor histidine kinase [Roseobacter sp. HKCCD7357]NNV18269.1 sensor histidine kinase [Roseobacter sp. HKCCD8768]NNV27756.1 sensor histidine kinase [Roseobacter sp. HKCCD8192]NNV32031.1 sensor histidine kinase [Roseobacter sp. HKCCD9061]